jgi:TolB-like protein/Tfp pilus assembly protein PilF
LSGELREIIAKSMAATAADRYPDVAIFAAALRRSGSGSAFSASLRNRTMRYVLVGAVFAAIVGIGTLLYMPTADSPGRPVAAAPRGSEATIAVLPFVDLSEKRDRGYLSDGLAEELIDLLTKIPELRVTARASSFALRDQKHDIASIARQLSVNNVLEGSVRASGSRVKISVQLVRTADGTVIWSDTYDRELKDIFEIQEDVASAVVDALKLRLLAGHAVSADRRTTNLPAYEEYLLGRQYRDGASLERHQRAQAAFQRAVALDDSFAPAHAGLALASADIGGATMQTSPYDVALAEAEKAMALAPRLVEAYVARAQVRMNRNWDFVGAKSDLDVAMRIDPNNMELLQAYATFLWITGKLDQALAVQRRLVTRNPLASKTWDWLGVMLMNARDYPAARQALHRSVELSPYSDYRFLLRTLVEIYAGNFEEAMRLARSNPSAFQRDYTLAMAAFSLGQTAESHAARERLIANLPDAAASQIAVIYAWQGNEEQAFVWLDRAIALRDPGLFGIQTRPGFDQFRDDPRFQRVLRLMNVVD